MAGIIGPELAKQVEELSLKIYTLARDYAETKGVIIADTKFEFGVDEDGTLVLADEVLTPDSSRFWPRESYVAGKSQPRYRCLRSLDISHPNDLPCPLL